MRAEPVPAYALEALRDSRTHGVQARLPNACDSGSDVPRSVLPSLPHVVGPDSQVGPKI